MFDFYPQKGRDRTHSFVEFDREKLVLRVVHGKESWSVDLRLCSDASRLCFWILELNRKPWASNDLLGQFLWALTDACDFVFGEDPADVYTPQHGSSPRLLWLVPPAKKQAASEGPEGSEQ